MSDHAIANAKAWLEEIEERVDRIRAAQHGADWDALDAEREAILESVLSVMLRDSWYSPGQKHDAVPEEYEILLSTGGPALRIFGDLDSEMPDERPHLQWQDWGTPWTDYDLTNAQRQAVAEFARCFNFDEG